MTDNANRRCGYEWKIVNRFWRSLVDIHHNFLVWSCGHLEGEVLPLNGSSDISYMLCIKSNR